MADSGPAPENAVLHGTCVAFGRAGVLIVGASGSGKSALALQLMAFGAALVSDDRVAVEVKDGVLVASPPQAIGGMIEARHVGLLAAEAQTRADIRLIVDLDCEEAERLPPRRTREVMGVAVELVHNVASAYFPAALVQYMRGGRCA